MFWQNEKIQKEIINNIKEYYNKPDMTEKECEKAYELHCSTWGSIEELVRYLQDEDDTLNVSRVINSRNVFELSNGEWLMC